MNATREDKTPALIALSHNLGSASRYLAILGEGNTSARLSDETFLVKASGSSLGTMNADDLVECRFAPLLAMLDREDFSDVQIEEELFASRVDAQAKKPSVEAVFHAYLLSLPGANFIGHTHAESINSLLCSPHANDFATRRIFPDEIVCCGPASVLVPYIDPGVKLARAIRDNVEQYRARYDAAPRVILLQNRWEPRRKRSRRLCLWRTKPPGFSWAESPPVDQSSFRRKTSLGSAAGSTNTTASAPCKSDSYTDSYRRIKC
jgi:rhamnose utilization protein RhaD (predicted bifunctional aldolase and dehydrogenase)